MSPLVECGHCGYFHAGPCPRIKAIEYWQDGTVKRVEYHTAMPLQNVQVTIPYDGGSETPTIR